MFFIGEGFVSQPKQRLLELIINKSLKTGNFILASGASSNYLIDLKNTLLDPEGCNLVADLILEKLYKIKNLDAVGGLELGACPIVSSVCVKSFLAKQPINSFYVRKQKKDRGSNKLIEGYEIKKGDNVVILEDVITKGGSVMAAINIVRQYGANVIGVLAIVDRLEGARANLEQEHITLDSLFTKNDILK